jgi:7,8-dihydropterin-6-yl-methyl-4-(beta-D-ribofuranosyl)aminobenzene 5'-phosphate synthase
MARAAFALPFLWAACQRPAAVVREPSQPDSSRPSHAAKGGVRDHSHRGENYILNLFDSFGPERPGVEHAFGFSALLRYQGRTILFDAGSSADILARNAAALGVDLAEVDFAVASHSHVDHISGFDYLLEVNPNVTIYFPDDIFWGAPFDYDASGRDPSAAEALPDEERYFRGQSPKFRVSPSGRFWKANVEFVRQNRQIAPGVHLVATRSPFVGYFSRYPNVGGHGKFTGQGDTKFVELPELSLTMTTSQGEVLVVGCSHSMVDAITREAKAYRKRDVHLLVGGFHLLPYGAEEIREIARRLQTELLVQRVAPAHCTGHLGLKLFREAFGDHYHAAGLGRRIDFPPAP